MGAKAVDAPVGIREAADGSDARFASAAEMHDVLERLMKAIDADDRRGPILAATGVTSRMRYSDIGVVLEIWPSERDGRNLEWHFGERKSFKPMLELTMQSTFANRYMQGIGSLPIAIARGEVKVSGASRASLLFLPAARLFVDPYRRIVDAGHPHLRVR